MPAGLQMRLVAKKETKVTEHHADRDAGTDSDVDQDSHPAGPQEWESGQYDVVDDRPQAAAGPFTFRDVVVLGSVALMFIGSLIPFGIGPGYYSNLWNSSSLFFLGVGILLPLVVAGLFIVRRVSNSHPRIGSLSIDQFGSIAALFAAAYFFIMTVSVFGAAPLIALIGALALVAATTLAPHLPFFSADFAGRAGEPAHPTARASAKPAPKPPKSEHRTADYEQSAGYGQPGAQEPASFGASSFGRGSFSGGAYAADPDADRGSRGQGATADTSYSHQGAGYQDGDHDPDQDFGHYPGQDAGWDNYGYDETQHGGADVGQQGQPEASTGTAAFPAVGYGTRGGQDWEGARQAESFGATRDSYYADEEYGEEETYEAFWFAVGQPRDIVNEETGATEFTIEPGTWVLALQDRGDEFLVQHTDGRIGALRDLSNIERA